MHHESNVSGSAFLRLGSGSRQILPSADDQTLPDAPKILIFSHHFDTGLLLKTIFDLWGFQTFRSDALEHSLAIIETRSPNLILLDSVLPFAAHLENIRQIRREVANRIPILVISGFSQPEFKNMSIDAGANDFLVKPLDYDLLENYIHRFIKLPLRSQ
jgi:DNA-binding response OmpR family regulator